MSKGPFTIGLIQEADGETLRFLGRGAELDQIVLQMFTVHGVFSYCANVMAMTGRK